MRFCRWFKRNFLTLKFLSYALIGCFNTFVTAALNVLFGFILPQEFAFFPAYFLSLCGGYILNSLITFRQSLSFGKWLKYLISYIPNFVIQQLILFVVWHFGWDRLLPPPYGDFLAPVISSVIGTPVTFLILKFYTFITKSSRKD